MSHDTGSSTWRLAAGAAVMGYLLLSFSWAADQGTGGAAHSWQKEIVARVGAVQGDTKVQRAGEAKFKKIGAKSPLYIMDFVATGRETANYGGKGPSMRSPHRINGSRDLM